VRLFLSHSSKSKATVREIKKYIQEDRFAKTWFDEVDLIAGTDVEQHLQNTIQMHSDFVVIFVDREFVKSNWVAKELSWAVEVEQKVQRPFIIPVALDESAWSELDPPDLQKRKFVPLKGDDTEDVITCTRKLLQSLNALIHDEFEKASKAGKDDPSTKLDEATAYLNQMAYNIRMLVLPYRRNKKITIEDLRKQLNKTVDYYLTESKFEKILGYLQNGNHLAGIVFRSDGIYVGEEYYAWKTTLNTDAKKHIARKAMQYIKTGDIVILDAGSTTLEISRQICNAINLGALRELRVITNSVPAAYELIVLAGEKGLEDKSNILQVYQVGGRIRNNTTAVVAHQTQKGNLDLTDFKILKESLGEADVAFVGTNGILEEKGFTTESESEIKTKRAILDSARTKMIVTDSSKFIVSQENSFVLFDEDIKVITVKDSVFQEFRKNRQSSYNQLRRKFIFAGAEEPG